MHTYKFVPVSSNAKTGPIPVTITSQNSCPSTCPFMGNGCYAESGNMRIHWNNVSNGKYAVGLNDFVASIQALPKNQLWRHNTAGDLPGDDDTIDSQALYAIIKANAGKRGFTYTHKYGNAHDIATIRQANSMGFTINLSANNLSHADELSDKNCGPVVAVVPHDFDDKTPKYTPAGRKVKVCPAVRSDNVTCATCGLCQKADRDFIIAFPAHGARKKAAEKVVNNG